jgi:aerobic carbon-monoxide dehydrogenase medium subunit
MRFPIEMTRVLKEFGYFGPSRVDEAVAILGELGNRVMILAGGTDLLNQMKLRQVNPEFLLSLINIKELEYIRYDEGLKIGALTSITTIRESDIIRNGFISLYDAAEWFGTPQIRNMATVGGNVCRSSPSSDMVAPLMALDGMLRLVGPKGVRTIPMEDFATGSGENALDCEILTEVTVPQQEEPFGTAFIKLKRSSADLAKVSCAVRIRVKDGKCEDIRVVLGAVADKVFRAKTAEEVMRGEKVTDAVIEEAGKRASQEAQPITDVRSTAKYRMQMISVLTKRMIYSSLERLRQ